jgi:ribonuclease PH
VAAQDAVDWLMARGLLTESPICRSVAAVSVGMVGGQPMLDLDYTEDSSCDTDMNVVMADGSRYVEVQGTAEGAPFSRADMDRLLQLAEKGIGELALAQQAARAQ